MSNIPFINQSFIPDRKFNIDIVHDGIWDYCDSKYDMSFAKLKYIYPIRNCIHTYAGSYSSGEHINISTPGIVHLIHTENTTSDSTYATIYIIYNRLNIISGICEKTYIFELEEIEEIIENNSYEYPPHDAWLIDVRHKPDEYEPFDITNILKLPDGIYRRNYTPELIKIYGLCANLHHQIKTFQLCIYRKVQSKDIRQKIYSYLFFVKI